MLKPLKKHKVGYEAELLVLEEDGSVSNRADELISACHEPNTVFPVRKDYTKNMIEIGSIARVRVRKSARDFLKTLRQVMDSAEKLGLRIYPYAIYPGTHNPLVRTDRYYRMCEKVIGEKEYRFKTGHVMGFHFHYCLPWGVFNRNTKSLRFLFRSKNKEHLLNLYNMIIAADPAATTLVESSPFVDGRFVAKDARLFLYRSMKLNTKQAEVRGLYRDHELFGGFPRYQRTITDLINLTDRRFKQWKKKVSRAYPECLDVMRSKHPLQFAWGPLRINRVGTLEYRGMDMNTPKYVLGTSLLLKYILRRIRKENLRVFPSDVGVSSPFKIEGDKIHVPPYSILKDTLQFESAKNGLESDLVFDYTKRFVSLGMDSMPSRNDPSLNAVRRIISQRKSVSDKMIEYIKKKGFSLEEKLPEEFARELALKASHKLEKEVDDTMQKMLLLDQEE